MKKLIIILLACLQFNSVFGLIGTRIITYNDPARSGRAVQTYFYYPATSAGSSTPFAGATGVKYPLLVVGHGFTINFDNYEWIADSLVNDGYIVAIVNTETGFSPSHANYGLDLKFISEKLKSESNTNSSSPFYQRVSDKSACLGHSMGGGASFLACQSNVEFSCMATFAAAETTPSAISAAANITIPSLVFSGTEDCVAAPSTNQVLMYNALTACKSLAYIIDGNHCDFAEYDFNCTFGESTCNPTPTINDVTQMTYTMRLLKPWLSFWLKNVCNDWNSFSTKITGANYNNSSFTSLVSCTPIPVVTFSSPSLNMCSDSLYAYTMNPSISGGIPAYTYTWSPSTSLSSSSIVNPISTPTSTLVYTLTVTDNNNCNTQSTFTINVLSTPNPVISGSNNSCIGNQLSYSVPAIAGTSYNWVVTGGTIISGQGTPSIIVEWNSGVVGTVEIEQSNP